MDFKERLNEIRCCMPDKPEHYLRNQVILPCGDPVCGDCLKTSVSEFLCGRCGKPNSRLEPQNIMSNHYIVKLSDNYIETNLNGFSTVVIDQVEHLMVEIKSK